MQAVQAHLYGEAIDVLGPQVEFLSSLALEDDAFCLIRGTVNPGVVVPLHSHPDRELFHVLSGELEAFIEDGWRSIRGGGVLDVTDGIRHGWRNGSNVPAQVLIVTTVRIGRFFSEIGRPLAEAESPPTPEDVQRLFATSARYGYWNASPRENAEAGIALPMIGE
jgi:quercetin dioxygenase-like cupin family protein